MVQVKDEDKHLELVRWAVIRTKYGRRWMNPHPTSEILFMVDTREKAWKFLEDEYKNTVSKYPELLMLGYHNISKNGKYAFAGNVKVFGIDLHLQEVPLSLTDKEIVDTADYWHHNFVALGI